MRSYTGIISETRGTGETKFSLANSALDLKKYLGMDRNGFFLNFRSSYSISKTYISNFLQYNIAANPVSPYNSFAYAPSTVISYYQWKTEFTLGLGYTLALNKVLIVNFGVGV